jgi:hypothetical protein
MLLRDEPVGLRRETSAPSRTVCVRDENSLLFAFPISSLQVGRLPKCFAMPERAIARRACTPRGNSGVIRGS